MLASSRALTPAGQLYSERLARYVTANRNGQPDRVPLRPFAAEITARYAGYTCQEVTHDYRKGFEAVIRCCHDFEWDAVVANMVYVWTGLAQAAGLRYYGIPGIHVGPETAFQYREPSEEDAFMQPEEYDELIASPTRFLYEKWLPRVSTEMADPFRARIALVKSAMAMLDYFTAFGPQVRRMREECGTVSSICGMLKAPLDILGDKLRGYIGLAMDLKQRPEKVAAACQAMMPHLGYLALTAADPQKLVPIPIWMHRGCVPFISRQHFNTIYWPTLKPIVEALWAQGNQTLFYAEGKWDSHLEAFAELPAGSIIYHLDRTNPEHAHAILGKKFALSGGVSNPLLAFGTPAEVKARCRYLIETIGAEGGYIMDASAIMQNDATIENLTAMTDATLEYGEYRRPSAPSPKTPVIPASVTAGLPEWALAPQPRPGTCLPWEEKCKEYPPLSGDLDLSRDVWDSLEGFAYTYIWHLLLSF